MAFIANAQSRTQTPATWYFSESLPSVPLKFKCEAHFSYLSTEELRNPKSWENLSLPRVSLTVQLNLYELNNVKKNKLLESAQS